MMMKPLAFLSQPVLNLLAVDFQLPYLQGWPRNVPWIRIVFVIIILNVMFQQLMLVLTGDCAFDYHSIALVCAGGGAKG